MGLHFQFGWFLGSAFATGLITWQWAQPLPVAITKHAGGPKLWWKGIRHSLHPDLEPQMVLCKVTRHSDCKAYFCNFRSWKHGGLFIFPEWVIIWLRSAPLVLCVWVSHRVLPGPGAGLCYQRKPRSAPDSPGPYCQQQETRALSPLQMQALTFCLKLWKVLLKEGPQMIRLAGMLQGSACDTLCTPGAV